MSRFPSNNNTHLHFPQQPQVFNHDAQIAIGVHTSNDPTNVGPTLSNSQQQMLDQANHIPLQMRYNSDWRVCQPDYDAASLYFQQQMLQQAQVLNPNHVNYSVGPSISNPQQQMLAGLPSRIPLQYHGAWRVCHPTDNTTTMLPSHDTQINVGVHANRNPASSIGPSISNPQQQILAGLPSRIPLQYHGAWRVCHPTDNTTTMLPSHDTQINVGVHADRNPASSIGPSISNPQQQMLDQADRIPLQYHGAWRVCRPNYNSTIQFPSHDAQIAVGVHATGDPTSIGPSTSNSQQQMLDQADRIPLQMAYEDAWRVCNPDFKHPFTSLEDACERLLPYHVVADYEDDENEKIFDNGEMMSQSQQWDHDISTKMSEFTTIFEKQVNEFNLITKKQKYGELRTEERLMIENMLLQDEKQAMYEARAEMESKQRADQMAAMAYSQANFSTYTEMMFGGVSLESHMPQQEQATPMTNPGQGDVKGKSTMWRDE